MYRVVHPEFKLDAKTFCSHQEIEAQCEESAIYRILYFVTYTPGSTLHGYLSKILARSCQDLGKILAKIVTRYCQELQDAMVRSYQESHVSKKNLTKKPNMARKF